MSAKYYIPTRITSDGGMYDFIEPKIISPATIGGEWATLESNGIQFQIRDMAAGGYAPTMKISGQDVLWPFFLKPTNNSCRLVGGVGVSITPGCGQDGKCCGSDCKLSADCLNALNQFFPYNVTSKNQSIVQTLKGGGGRGMSKIMVIILIVAIVLGLIGFGVYFFMQRKKGKTRVNSAFVSRTPSRKR